MGFWASVFKEQPNFGRELDWDDAQGLEALLKDFKIAEAAVLVVVYF